MIQLPVDFTENMRRLLGDEEYKALEGALQGESPVSIRVNPLKWQKGLVHASSEKIPWAEGGYYLSERPAFTFDPLFHAGCYYVQEASSMFVQRVLEQSDAVERAHDAQRLAQLDTHLKRAQVDLTHCLLICPGHEAAVVTMRLLVVQGEVLEVRIDALALDTANLGLHHGTRKEAVLRNVLVVAARER